MLSTTDLGLGDWARSGERISLQHNDYPCFISWILCFSFYLSDSQFLKFLIQWHHFQTCHHPNCFLLLNSEPKWKINHNKVSINYNIYILNITFLRIWVYLGLDISCLLYSPYTPQFPPGLLNWIITLLIPSVALSRFYFTEVQWCATYTPSGKDCCPSCREWCQHWPPVANFLRDCLISNDWLRWRWGGCYKAPLFLFKAGELRWVSLAPQHIVGPAMLPLGLHCSSTPCSVQSHFLLPSTGRDRRAFPNKE